MNSRLVEDGAGEAVRLHCPQCGVMIEATIAETMVYCIKCRKWCREEEQLRGSHGRNRPALHCVRKGIRCH